MNLPKVYVLFFGSVLLAHFLTRVFTQRCLLRWQARGLRVRQPSDAEECALST